MSSRREKHRSRSPDNYENKSRKKIKEDDKFIIFHKYKHELNYVLNSKHNLVKNLDDFWNFLNKYESMQKRIDSMQNTSDKKKLIFLKLSEKTERFFERLPIHDRNGDRVKMNFPQFEKFIDILLIYIDFKQKEKFNNLKKLRKSQAQLPIAEYRQEIIESVKCNRVVLIAGDTGCGKSTQVPQYIHNAGFKKIACTQPRRLACISLAKRVAYETLTENNATVGYQIRFEKTKRKGTNIIFITEGLLLRQTSDEETLMSYDVIILDEVHERHLHGDFLIGIMKCLLYKRDDLKLILMSATININLFSEYFAAENIKVIQVPGRLYPIDIVYKPIVKDRFEKQSQKFDPTPYLQVLQIIDEKYPTNERGDLLIFLSGLSDITALANFITEYSKEKGNWIVLQLHSSLSLAEQDKVFDYPPEGIRKCIISTNIAETSVTIDGIRFVVDSGKVNRMSYNMSGGINKLTEVSISQDSAKQRSGRAGRTGPGVSYRLYSEKEFEQFDPFTKAEIHLVPLEALVLNMVSLGLSDVANFPFLEKPEICAVKNAVEKLQFYGALLEEETLKLTPLGEALSKLPVDLTIGKMLITSTIFRNVTPVLCLAAVISVQSPYTNKAHRDLDCQQARKDFESDYGDPITLLNLFIEWLRVKQNTKPLENSSTYRIENSKQWSRKRGLEEQRFYEVIKLISQFKDILEDSELLNKNPSTSQSSSERAIRHGELKKLKSMRYQLKNEMRSSKRKQLKYNLNTEEDDEEYSKTDIRDVEFRISTDKNSLETLLNESSVDNGKDLVILKLVLCNGLYPQMAIADEYNYCKSPAEQLFHTKLKNYLALHPMGYFSYNPSSLKLTEEDIEVPPSGYFSKNPLSNKHQILVYQSVLETTKPYLMNTMRMPALQTLLLFCKKICTNETMTKIICDDFFMIDIPYIGQGKSLLLKAIHLRKKWEILLNDNILGKVILESFDDLSKTLINDLHQYIYTKISYTIKRLLKADLKTVYTVTSNKLDLESLNVNIFDIEYVAHANKTMGGIQVSENVIYNCVVEEDWSMNLAQKVSELPLQCLNCQGDICGRFIDKLHHEEMCKKKIDDKSEEHRINVAQISNPNFKEYICKMCQRTFHLSSIDILKHKKMCKSN